MEECFFRVHKNVSHNILSAVEAQLAFQHPLMLRACIHGKLIQTRKQTQCYLARNQSESHNDSRKNTLVFRMKYQH